MEEKDSGDMWGWVGMEINSIECGDRPGPGGRAVTCSIGSPDWPHARESGSDRDPADETRSHAWVGSLYSISDKVRKCAPHYTGTAGSMDGSLDDSVQDMDSKSAEIEK